MIAIADPLVFEIVQLQYMEPVQIECLLIIRAIEDKFSQAPFSVNFM